MLSLSPKERENVNITKKIIVDFVHIFEIFIFISHMLDFFKEL